MVNTFRFTDKDVLCVDVYPADARMTGDIDSHLVPLVVTGTHAFWVNGIGWTRADHLRGGNELELVDGRSAVVFNVARLLCTVEPDVAGIQGGGFGLVDTSTEVGRVVDLRTVPRSDYDFGKASPERGRRLVGG